MSVRQDNENKNCPSRGLAIAAAAVGVGVGAALYYLFSKREDPDSSGATSSWNCEREHALSNSSEASFTTISEHSTTDTSINTSINSSDNNTSHNETSFNETSFNETSFNETSDSSSNDSSESFINAPDSNTDESFTDDPNFVTGTESNEETESFIETSLQSDMSFETGYMTLNFNYSINYSSSFTGDNTSTTRGFSIDSDTNTEWDVTTSSLDVPHYTRPNLSVRIIDTVRNLTSPRRRKDRTEEQQMAILREQAFRERTWTAEECSICFDMMTQTQEVMALPCTHRFHQACILPWLQERQTCPNCRKTA